jgi:3-(3-hydroxy-phenyl)propionate hydroxylase
MHTHSIAIVGAGPTGLLLASELALAGVDVVVIERRADSGLNGPRAGGLLPRTLEHLDQRGIADRFTAAGARSNHFEFAGVPLDMTVMPTRYNYILSLRQIHIEKILNERLAEQRVPVMWGCEVTGLTQTGDAVHLRLANGAELRAAYVVGCDGGRSTVRKLAGIEFPGTEPTTSNLIAEAKLAQDAPLGIVRDARGIRGIGKVEDDRMRIMLTERSLDASGPPTLDDLRAELSAAYGSDFGVHDAVWISRFTDATRQAAKYREGRVFLAGDAAHVHPPDGGQGVQTGMQDAMNLGWKLAQVANGISPDSLLDTYHAERHPVAARVFRNSKVFVTLRREDDRTQALKGMFAELLSTPETRDRVTAMLAGLDIRYEFGAGHALLGRRMPDLDLSVAGQATRVYALMHDARPLLLHRAPGLDTDFCPTRVKTIEAQYEGAADAVLIRPDGYVAWAADASREGLDAACREWFSAAARSG